MIAAMITISPTTPSRREAAQCYVTWYYIAAYYTMCYVRLRCI